MRKKNHRLDAVQLPLELDDPVIVPMLMAQQHADQFTEKFLHFLPLNLHVYRAFELQALRIFELGFQHYSARTILHFLRHETNIQQRTSGWKLDNDHSPYFARLFDLLNPSKVGLWEYRITKPERAAAEEFTS